MSADPTPLLCSAPPLMRLAVVERQLIMQLLDLADLARFASTCSQLGSEALHPQCGRFQPTAVEPFPPAPLVIKPLQPQHMSHLSPVVRAHRPMSVRLDGLAAIPASPDRAAKTEALLQAVSSFSRIVSLSLWDSPPDWTEEIALRLLSLVAPSVELLWGVRSGTIWVDNARLQEALFSLPHLTAVRGLAMSFPNGALLPNALMQATKLHTILLMPPPNLSPLRPLAVLPALTRLEVCCSSEDDEMQVVDPAALSFPLVRECEVLADSWPRESGISPSAVLTQLLSAMRALELLQLKETALADSALECCMELGPTRLPRLCHVVLRDNVAATIARAFLAAFPKCELPP